MNTMNTLFCPECKYPLAMILKDETIDEWKECPKCKIPSYLLVGKQGEPGIVSLTEIIKDMRAHKHAIEALVYILKNDTAWLDDLTFNVGKAVENDLILLVELHVLEVDRAGKHYSIANNLQKALATELVKYVPPQQWLKEMAW